nr:serpin-ZX [Tanacetum cinerariifolium]
MISYTFEAKDVMKQMGLTLPFEETNDEISRIVDLRTLFGNTLYVSKILQKSFTEVDEKGTKAAAISFMECEVGANMSDSDSKPLPPPTFSPSFILLKQILSNRKTGLQFSLANGVWVDRRAEPIQCSYQKVLETVYRTEARYVDFRDKVKCGEAVNKINSWVHKETKGLITSIVERHELSKDSIMVIANTLYFKEEWENPFYAHETKDKDFSLITGEKVLVPFMISNKEFEYGSFKGYKMIKIPYESNKLGKSKKFLMYIFLPHKKAGLKKLLQKFHSNDALFQDNKKDKTAIAFLFQALPEEQLLQIAKHKTAKAIWDALKTRLIGEERVQQARLQTLKFDFEMLHMKEDETIDTFTGKLTTLVNKAASLGHIMEDETLVRKLLNVVPDRYLQIVTSIEQYSDLSEMTMEEAIGRLKTYEERIKIPSTGVYYAPKVTLNILSIDLLEKQGYELKYEGNRCSLVYMFNNKESQNFDEDRMRTMHNQCLEEYFESLDASTDEDLIQIKGLSKGNGEEIKRCYINYLDVFTSYFKTARAPQQRYKDILEESTRKVEEKDIDYLIPHQWDFGKDGAPIAKSVVLKEKETLEHFGVKLEDTRDSQDQPILPHSTRNQNL